jgi:hypothetical protein
MTLVALPSPIWYPNIVRPEVESDAPALRTLTIDADDEYHGLVFQIPPGDDGKTITTVWWRTATVTTGDELDVRLEGVDGDGNPDDTLATVNSNKVVDIQDGDDNIPVTTTLTAGHTVSAAEELCVYIVRQNGSAFVGQISANRRGPVGLHFPYKISNAGADAKNRIDSDVPSIAIGYDDSTWLSISGAYPAYGHLAASFANDEKGLKFQVPMPCEVNGLYLQGGADSIDADFSIHLYNAAGKPGDVGGTRLSTASFLAKHTGINAVAASRTLFFGTAVELAKDTVYHATIEATTANNCKLAYFDVDAAARLLAMPGGANWTWIEDGGGGEWTPIATRTPILGLLVTKLDNGAGGGGGGGGVRNPLRGPI